MPNTSFGPPVGTPALANSSATITCSSAVSPAPPYSVGQPGASRLFSNSVLRHSFTKVSSSSPSSEPMPFQLLGSFSARNACTFSR